MQTVSCHTHYQRLSILRELLCHQQGPEKAEIIDLLLFDNQVEGRRV